MIDLEVPELYQIAWDSAAVADQSVEFWIGISFAVAIVSYVTGASLRMRVRTFLAVLYLLTTAILYARFHDAATVLHASFEAIQALGPQYVVPTHAPAIKAMMLNQLVVFVGTFGVLASLFFPSLLKERKQG